MTFGPDWSNITAFILPFHVYSVNIMLDNYIVRLLNKEGSEGVKWELEYIGLLSPRENGF